MPSAPESPASVRRRRVLYVSGFDPQGPARYHRMNREQAAAQSRVSGHAIEVGPRERIDPRVDAWTIAAEIEGHHCETRYEFLRWDDVVRANWMPGHARYLAATLAATWRFASSGVLWRLLKCSRPGFSVCFGPFCVLMFIALAALLLLAAVIASWQLAGPGPWFAA